MFSSSSSGGGATASLQSLVALTLAAEIVPVQETDVVPGVVGTVTVWLDGVAAPPFSAPNATHAPATARLTTTRRDRSFRSMPFPPCCPAQALGRPPRRPYTRGSVNRDIASLELTRVGVR